METPLKARDITDLYDQSYPFFKKHWDLGEVNERYRSINHFNDEEKAQIESQGRTAYSIALISNKIDFHVAHQRKNRTEWKLEAINDSNDEIKAQVGNIQFRDLEHRSDMRHVESDVFDSGIAIRFGAAEIVLDYDKNLNPIPKVIEVDYRDVMWDANSIKYDKSDALWMAKMTKVSRFQIREQFGDKAAKSVSTDYEKFGRDKQILYISPNKDDQDLDIITLFTHYQKVLRKYYLVIFNDYANLHGNQDQLVALRTLNKKEAEDYLRKLEIPYIAKGLPLGQSNGIESQRKVELDKYVLTYDKILEYEETDLPAFPLSIYHSYFFKGNFWTLTDVLKSPQEFVDKYLAQIDFSFGTDIKNAYAINVALLADGFSPEEAVKQLQNDGIIFTKASGAIEPLRGQGINPQWMQMIQIMQSFIEDLAGGRSFQGLSEGKDESGKAIKLKQEQGQGLASLFIDNLNRWKRDLGAKLLWWFNKYDTAERIIKVGGSQMSPQVLQMLQQIGLYTPGGKMGTGYLRINTPITHLGDAEFELKVTEAQLSESAREKKLAQLALLGQVNPSIQAIPKYNEMFLSAFDMEYTDKMELIAEYKSFLQAQAQAAQVQQQAEAQSQAVQDAIQVAELKLKEKELSIKKNDSDNKKSKTDNKSK